MKNMFGDIIFPWAAGIILGAIVIGMVHLIAAKNRYTQRLEAEIEHYQKTFPRKQGFSSGFGNFNLVSIDGGKHWYNVEDGTPADSKLLAHLMGWDTLVKLREHNGAPLDITKPEHREALKNAGFEITHNF